jgi:hypothetical protein
MPQMRQLNGEAQAIRVFSPFSKKLKSQTEQGGNAGSARRVPPEHRKVSAVRHQLEVVAVLRTPPIHPGTIHHDCGHWLIGGRILWIGNRPLGQAMSTVHRTVVWETP